MNSVTAIKKNTTSDRELTGKQMRFAHLVCNWMIYETLEDAINSAKEFADAFDMDGFAKIIETLNGEYELFRTGKWYKPVWD